MVHTMHPLEPATFNSLFTCYFFSFILYIAYALNQKETYGKAATLLLGIGFLFNTVNLVLRGLEAGRVPFSNLYESLLIFMWGIALCLLWSICAWRLFIIGPVIVPLILALAVFSLRVDRQI